MKALVLRTACCCLLGSVAANAGAADAAKSRMDPAKFHIGAYGYHYPFLWTEEKVKELRDCGLDFVFGVPIQQRQVLDWLQKYGLGCVAVGVTGIDHTKTSEELRAERPLDRYEADMDRFLKEQDHPAVWMLNLTDEPTALGMDYIGEVCRMMLKKSPQTPPCVNLYPNYARVVESEATVKESQLGTRTYREHIDVYCRTSPLDYISYDFYVMFDDPQDIRNWTKKMYDNYEIAAEVCRKTGRDLWYIPQVNVRPWCKVGMSANKLRYQAFTAMAYGAVSINWACWGPFWWHGNVYDKQGVRDDALYGRLKEVNGEIRTIASYFMNFRNVATHRIGGTDGNADFGNGRVVGLKASDGSELLVGEMAARRPGACESALFVVAAGDPTDERKADHEIVFQSAHEVAAVGTTGKTEIRRDGSDRLSMTLKDNQCALIIMR